MPYDMSASLPYDSPVVVENPEKRKFSNWFFSYKVISHIIATIFSGILLLELATSDWATEFDVGVLFDPDWGAELGGWGRT